jgi:hypothetical protein
MKTITHEGQEYILKSEVDGIVRERLSKVAEGKRIAEGKVTELEEQLSSMNEKVKGVDAMASQLSQLQDELAVSNQRYERHSAIASHGITDPEIRDLIEWQYNKSMDGRLKKDKVPLSEWIGGMKENGEVPLVLQPYFKTEQSSQPVASTPQPQPMASTPQPQPVASTPHQQMEVARPSTNQGVAPTQDHATSADLWKKAGSDFDFYRQNRTELKKQYYQMRNSRFKA